LRARGEGFLKIPTLRAAWSEKKEDLRRREAFYLFEQPCCASQNAAPPPCALRAQLPQRNSMGRIENQANFCQPALSAL
jgi:hypothetical protein